MMNDVMTLQEISDTLQDRNLMVISRRINLSHPTLVKLREGVKINYTLKTLQTISNYLRKSEHSRQLDLF